MVGVDLLFFSTSVGFLPVRVVGRAGFGSKFSIDDVAEEPELSAVGAECVGKRTTWSEPHLTDASNASPAGFGASNLSSIAPRRAARSPHFVIEAEISGKVVVPSSRISKLQPHHHATRELSKPKISQ